MTISRRGAAPAVDSSTGAYNRVFKGIHGDLLNTYLTLLLIPCFLLSANHDNYLCDRNRPGTVDFR